MQRVIALEGGRNFRDLGGYATVDDRRVRWGRLYRSGAMSYLTPNDHAALRSRGIRLLCDFRTRREREREAVDWDGEGRVRLEWDYDPRLVSVRALLTDAGVSVQSGLSTPIARAAMFELYRQLPTRLAEPYAALFERLAADDLPLVFACSAGKDRTGVAAALVLACLGVPWDAIVADFTLTNHVVDLEQVLFQDPRRSVGLEDEHGQLVRLGHEARTPFLDAAPDYLAAAFEQIHRDHGSVEEFLRTKLGVDAAKTLRIRGHLLEP